MTEFCSLYWRPEEARLKGFTTSNRGGATTLKIEIQIVDPHALGMLMTSLQEAQQQAKPAPPHRQPDRPRRSRLAAPDMLALPAPYLRIEDGRDDA